MLHLHPKVPAIDYNVSKDVLVEQAEHPSPRGVGLGEESIKRHYNPKALSLLGDSISIGEQKLTSRNVR